MKKVFVSAGILALAIGLSGCGMFPGTQNSDIPNPAETISEAKASIAAESSARPIPAYSSSPSPSTAQTEVNWADYDPGTQAEIERLVEAADCIGLNSFFGMAVATEEKIKLQTGHGNERLIEYLNISLRTAGCQN